MATPPPRTAFEWVLLENVAYPADDARRTEAFALLKRVVCSYGNATMSP